VVVITQGATCSPSLQKVWTIN